MALNFDAEKVQRAKMRSSARNQMSMIDEDQKKQKHLKDSCLLLRSEVRVVTIV